MDDGLATRLGNRRSRTIPQSAAQSVRKRSRASPIRLRPQPPTQPLTPRRLGPPQSTWRGSFYPAMTYQNLYEHLIEDIRQLKLDFETLAAGSSLYRDAYFDAADMTKFILEKDEQRH